MNSLTLLRLLAVLSEVTELLRDWGLYLQLPTSRIFINMPF